MQKKLLLIFKNSHEFLIPALLSSFFGLMVLLSLSPEDFKRQLIFIAIGLVVFILVSLTPLDLLQNSSIAALLIIYILLGIIFFVGESTRGSVRWLDLGFFRFQPSEFAKPLLILSLSLVLGSKHFTIKRFFVACFIASPGIILTLIQPDLGTALVLIVIFGVMVLFSGIKPLFSGVLGGFGACLGFLGFTFGLRDYQKARLTTFLNPENDPLGAGYNVLQSKIAVGSGRLLGKGFGHGSQSHLNFLPESKTDFIFASLAEEWGFAGSFLIIVFLTMSSFAILRLHSKLVSKSGKLICLGVWAVLLFQGFVNIGMNIGIMPVTGIPLPFVSLGGSSIIAFFIMFGTLVSVAKQQELY